MTPEELEQLAVRLAGVERRNARVEGEKAWETSAVRKLFIAVLTYCIVAAVFLVTEVDRPFLGALIPTLGYLLSTQSLPWLKERWLRRHGFLPPEA